MDPSPTLMLFIQATTIGLFLAMPIGPIALFCMRNSLCWGVRYGVISGMGSAVADALYGLCALFGMVALSLWLSQYHEWLHAMGGIVLCFIGLRMLWNFPIRTKIPLVPLPLPVLFLVSFLLTLANPGTFLLVCALYSNFDVCLENVSWHQACTLSLGIFLGSTLWWFLLSAFTAWSYRNVPVHMLLWARRIMGALFFSVGCFTILSAFKIVPFTCPFPF